MWLYSKGLKIRAQGLVVWSQHVVCTSEWLQAIYCDRVMM